MPRELSPTAIAESVTVPRALVALAGHGKTAAIRRAASKEIAARYGLRRVRWAFDDMPTFDGFTDNTTWNGFLNVWVIPAVHDKVIVSMGREHVEESGIGEIVPDERGLISYAGGFTAQEV